MNCAALGDGHLDLCVQLTQPETSGFTDAGGVAFVSIVSSLPAGRLEGASDKPEFEVIRRKTRLLQRIANQRLAEVTLGRPDTCSVCLFVQVLTLSVATP